MLKTFTSTDWGWVQPAVYCKGFYWNTHKLSRGKVFLPPGYCTCVQKSKQTFLWDLPIAHVLVFLLLTMKHLKEVKKTYWKCYFSIKSSITGVGMVNKINFPEVLLNKWDVLRDLVPFAQLKNAKNTHGEVILLVKVQVSACNFTKSIVPPWVFFSRFFFKLYKCYQTAQSIRNIPYLQRTIERTTYFLKFYFSLLWAFIIRTSTSHQNVIYLVLFAFISILRIIV